MSKKNKTALLECTVIVSAIATICILIYVVINALIIEYEIKSVRNTIEKTIHEQGYKTSGYGNDVIKVYVRNESYPLLSRGLRSDQGIYATSALSNYDKERIHTMTLMIIDEIKHARASNQNVEEKVVSMFGEQYTNLEKKHDLTDEEYRQISNMRLQAETALEEGNDHNHLQEQNTKNLLKK